MQAFAGLLQTMRPKQWAKNIFVFAAIVFDRQLGDMDALVRVIVAFVLLILISGTVYIINDLADIEKDRHHPKKQHRPLPSGRLPVQMAILAAILIPAMTLLFASFFDVGLAIVLAIYLGIQTAYSFALKNIVIIDVLTVTSGFVLRVLAGVTVIDVENFSPWLYACAGLLALFLAVGKRRGELVELGQEKAIQSRPIFKDYNIQLLDNLLQFVITATFLTYLIYTIEADTAKFADINLSLLTVPFVLYALMRYTYLIHVRGEGSAPDEVVLKDRPLQLAFVLWGLTFIVLLYLLPASPA